MYIYKITNMLDGTFYIGQTINPSSRWSAHKRCYYSEVGKAILKNGYENFKFEVIFECNHRDANLLESYLIYKYDLINKGYNVVYSKHLDEYDLAKAQVLLDKIYNGSYVLTGEYMSKSKDNKRVYCLDYGIVFDNVIECSTFYNIVSGARVREVCLGKRATANGLTFRFLDENDNIIEPETSVKKKTVEVYVEETCTIYSSIKDACDDLGIDYSKGNASIGKHLDGRTEHTYGYHFHYVENDEIVPSKYVSGKRKKKVLVDNLHTFDSVSEAISYYELPANARGAIGQCCNGKSGSAYGHTWSYLDDSNQPIVKDFYYSSIDRSKVKRYEIICDNTLVFRSLAKAVQHFGWNSNELKHISKVCKEGGGMYKGHIWNYGKEI